MLNCCSVNGPRGFGILSQWAIMRNDKGLAVNYYGPMQTQAGLTDGTPVAIEQTTDYPVGGSIRIKVSPKEAKGFTLSLRIPAWSVKTEVSLNGKAISDVKPGSYLALARQWQPGDEIVLKLDMSVRYESGDLEQAGNVSLYRGPILLCVDDRFKSSNSIKIDVNKLNEAKLTAIDDTIKKSAAAYPPWLVVDLPTSNGKTLRLVDFASAGATGGGYQSWLPAINAAPPRPVAWLPADGATFGLGTIRFRWRKPATSEGTNVRHAVVVSESPDFASPITLQGMERPSSLVVPKEAATKLRPKTVYYWKVVATNAAGKSESLGPAKRFAIDPSQPQTTDEESLPRASDDAVLMVPLRGGVKPEYGKQIDAAGWKPAVGPDGQSEGAIELDGNAGRLKYDVSPLQDNEYADYTAAVWLSVARLPNGNGQVLSAWHHGMDDPLRVVVAEGELFARIEADSAFGTNGKKVGLDQWHHVVSVKQGGKLTLFVDGKPVGEAIVPTFLSSQAKVIALGGNPNFAGPEFLAARFADLRLYARALSADEIKKLYELRKDARQ